ncbi:MAG: AAA family ATPase [Pirellulaceae bacterium]
MSLTTKLNELIAACFTGIWIETHEQQDALIEIAQLCHDQQWQLATWDIDRGLVTGGGESSDATDPLTAIRSVGAATSTDQTTILVISHLHRFIQSTEIMQALQQQILVGKQTRTFIIGLSPVVSIPVELEKLFVVVEHDLPNQQQLEEIARGIATEDGELPAPVELHRVLEAAAGLTRLEAEGAFSLSLVRNQRISADAVWELKSQTLRKSGLLNLYQGTEDFASLGGLDSLKTFCKRSLIRRSGKRPLPKGVLLLSPPGCGKSQFCKCLGKETGRPVLILDVGTLMGSLVGESEQRTRQALRIIDAMAPCVVMIDEVEKAFAGVGGSGGNDSGVSARMFGSFLAWLNDHRSDAYVVCTSNDIRKLPPEFGRSERFDGIFFLDLPGRQQKDAIWSIYLEQFELEHDQQRPDDTQWTGAEIRACCRLAALLDMPLTQAAHNIVPVAVTASEAVEQQRTWANGRCLNADAAGIYRHQTNTSSKRRTVNSNPSLN